MFNFSTSINTKHGIPSTDVAKELGVTLKTAWRMGHKIRTRIVKQESQFIVEGIVQIDEMYLSHAGSKKQGRSLINKTLIVGIYEKTTNNLIVKVLKNAKSKNLLQFARKHISSNCDVYTDSWKGYRHFKSVFNKHETVPSRWLCFKNWCKYQSNWISMKTYTKKI